MSDAARSGTREPRDIVEEARGIAANWRAGRIGDDLAIKHFGSDLLERLASELERHRRINLLHATERPQDAEYLESLADRVAGWKHVNPDITDHEPILALGSEWNGSEPLEASCGVCGATIESLAERIEGMSVDISAMGEMRRRVRRRLKAQAQKEAEILQANIREAQIDIEQKQIHIDNWVQELSAWNEIVESMTDEEVSA